MRVVAFLILCFVSLSADIVSLHGYVPKTINKHSLEQCFYSIRRTIDSTATPDSDTVQIIFYKKSEQHGNHGIRLPEWGGGGAIGKDSIVLPVDVPSVFYEGNFEQILAHEFVHIAINRLYGNIRVPRWFHEGLAMTLAGEVSLDEQVLLARAIVLRAQIPLDSIDYVNRFNHYKASLAYSQAHAVVTYLITMYGKDLIPELLNSSKTKRHFEDACVEVFGLTTKEIESLFVKDAQNRYPLLMMTSDFSLFWLLVLFLAVIAFAVTMVRRSKRKKEMTIEEMVEDEKNETIQVDPKNVDSEIVKENTDPPESEVR